ncbi:MAG: hypothetical protein HRT35_04115 [Algicola sp.]|nr:hypothetical protein [Algicola sp.]
MILKRLSQTALKTAAVIGGLCLSTSLMAAPSVNEKSAIGINLTGINYWSTQWMLIDVMRQASNGSGELWATTKGGVFNTGHQSALDLDTNGWPKSLPSGSAADFDSVSTIIYLDNTAYPVGEYVVLYEGEGQLSYTGATLLPEKSTPGRDVLQLNAGSVFFLKIRQTDPQGNGNYLRNVQVIAPGGICGNEPTAFAEVAEQCADPAQFNTLEQIHSHQNFHPLFLKDMSKYRSLRFMQMFATNGSEQYQWSDRATFGYASWALNAGAPIEVAIDMANKVQAEPWLNIPARVDDDYMRQYAKLVKNTLDANLNVHIELGNEVWNNSYPYIFDANWMTAEGEKLWPEAQAHPLTYRLNYFGKRTSDMCEIFKAEFGEQANRVKCVLGAQGGNSWIGNESLSCPLWAAQNNGRDCSHNLDSVAIGPYFAGYLVDETNLPHVKQWADMGDAGLDKLFEEINTGLLRDLTYDATKFEWQQAPEGGSLAQTRVFMADNKELAELYGLELVAYEGGQHLTFAGNLTGDRAHINEALFLKGNRDPRMGQAFTDHFTDWKNSGGGLYMVFESIGEWGAYGSFTLKEHQMQPLSETPKLAATLDFIDANPCWWTGCDRVTNAFDSVQIDELPEAPQLAQIELTSDVIMDAWGVSLSWSAVLGSVDSYQIFRDGNYAGQTAAGTTEFNNYWLSLHQDYVFQVKAMNAAGVVVGESNLVTTMAGDSVAPTVPSSITAIANGGNGFDLSWTASTDDGGVAYYLIYRNGTPFTISLTASFSDYWLPQGDTTYQIFARDPVGNVSQGSVVITVTR